MRLPAALPLKNKRDAFLSGAIFFLLLFIILYRSFAFPCTFLQNEKVINNGGQFFIWQMCVRTKIEEKQINLFKLSVYFI